MKYEERHYQAFITNRIVEQEATGAFVDMGLGKTASTLKAFHLLNYKGKTLIVAPLYVAEVVWEDEISKWDVFKKYSLVKILGSEKERLKAIKQKGDLYIINRENLVWLINVFGSNWPYKFVIVDESSSFKNHEAKRFKAFKLIRKYIDKIVLLTGTPMPNGFLDLWSQMFMLDRGKRLGESFTRYRDKYFEPNKRNAYSIFSYKLKKGDELLGEDFYQKEILDSIKQVCFSMKTEDYLELPEMVTYDRRLNFDKATMKKYLDFERDQVLQLANEEELSVSNASGLTNKLLQFTNGFVYDEDKIPHKVNNLKLECLEEMVEELNEKPLIVFYKFVADEEAILRKFKFARKLKGKQDIEDWNNKKIRMFVLHPASAGHGLNLQHGGNNIVWFNSPWGLEYYEQGIKRLHRSGITEKVINTRLIVSGTIDEDVILSLSSKATMQDAVMKAAKARIEKWTKKSFY